MPAVYPTRSRRLEKTIQRMSTSWKLRSIQGRPTARLIARISRVTQAYCDACEAERCGELPG